MSDGAIPAEARPLIRGLVLGPLPSSALTNAGVALPHDATAGLPPSPSQYATLKEWRRAWGAHFGPRTGAAIRAAVAAYDREQRM